MRDHDRRLILIPLVVVGVLLVLQYRNAGRGRRSFEAFVASFPSGIPWLARPSGGFPPGGISPSRSGGQNAPSDPGRILAAEALQRIARESGDPLDAQRLAVAHLALGQTTEAIDILTRLTQGAPGDAALWSDLAAARLSHFERVGDYDQLPLALEAAARAVEGANPSPESLFNHARVQTLLGLREPALRSWRALALFQRDDGWSAVAEAAIRELSAVPPVEDESALPAFRSHVEAGDVVAARGIATRSPEVAQLYFEEELLPAARGGDPRWLRRLETLADAEPLGGDRTPALLAVALKGPSSPSRARFFEALALFGAARQSYRQQNWDASARQIVAARDSLAALSRPMWNWASLYLSTLDFQLGRPQVGLERLAQLIPAVDRTQQPSLIARASYLQGVITFSSGQYDEAWIHYRYASELFAAVGDAAWSAFSAQQMSATLLQLRRPGLGWKARVDLMNSLSGFADRSRRRVALQLLGNDCATEGLPRAASEFLREALRLGQIVGAPGLVASVEISLARSLAPLDPDESRTLFRSAHDRLLSLNDESFKRRSLVEYYRSVGEVASLDESEGLEALDRAIDWLESRKALARAVPLIQRRGEYRMRTGQREQGLADYEKVKEIVATISAPDPDLVASFASFSRNAIGEILEARTDLSPGAALELAEGVWKLTSGADRPEPGPGGIDGLVRAMAPGSGVIAMFPARQRVHLWLITSEGITTRSVAIRREALTEAAARLRGAVARQQEDAEAASRLADGLLVPFAPSIVGLQSITIVGTSDVHRVPWRVVAAARGIRLPERLSLASSLARLERVFPHREPEMQPRTVSLSYSPSSPGLPPLPRAHDEADLAAALSARGVRLSGPAANAERLLSDLPSATVVHIAAHGIVNEARPVLSSLLLAGDGGDRSLTVRQIREMRLSGTRLVVLSSCDSARPSKAFEDSSFSLADAFITAGADVVVGTLWPVSDDQLLALMREFYGSLRRGSSIAAALYALQQTPSGPGQGLVALAGCDATAACLDVPIRSQPKQHESQPH